MAHNHPDYVEANLQLRIAAIEYADARITFLRETSNTENLNALNKAGRALEDAALHLSRVIT